MSVASLVIVAAAAPPSVPSLRAAPPALGVRRDFAAGLAVHERGLALVADRAEVARDMCFTVWAADAVTLELADATEYDVDKGYPPADEDGVFCWTPVEITGKGAT